MPQDPFYTGSFDIPIQAVDLYRNGMSQQQEPMDYGSFGAFDGLSSYPNPMEQQQVQPDPVLTSMQFGIGEQNPSFAPQIQSNGSIFTKLLSSAVMGIAMSGGAQDPLTAFSAGYQSNMIRRQQEQQLLMQQQKMQQQQDLYDLKRMKEMMDMMKLKAEIESAPVELKNKTTQAEAAMITAMQAAGKTPAFTLPATAESVAQIKEATEGQPWKYIIKELGNQIVGFVDDPSEMAPPGTVLPFGNGTKDFSGMPWSHIDTQLNNQASMMIEAYKQMFQAKENQANRLNQQTVAGIYAKGKGGSDNADLGQNKAEAQPFLNAMNEISKQIYGGIVDKKQIPELQAQWEKLNQQYQNLVKGSSNPNMSGMPTWETAQIGMQVPGSDGKSHFVGEPITVMGKKAWVIGPNSITYTPPPAGLLPDAEVVGQAPVEPSRAEGGFTGGMAALNPIGGLASMLGGNKMLPSFGSVAQGAQMALSPADQGIQNPAIRSQLDTYIAQAIQQMPTAYVLQEVEQRFGPQFLPYAQEVIQGLASGVQYK